jgi:hypothetical protein
MRENLDNKCKKHREAKSCFMLLIYLVVFPEAVLLVSPKIAFVEFVVH